MSFRTLSAILRGGWLIDKAWADAHMPLVISVLKGQGSFASLFGEPTAEDEERERIPLRVGRMAGTPIYQVGRWTDLSQVPAGSYAIIGIKGPIMKYGGLCSYGSVDYVQAIQRADASENIKGIIIDFDTPGGQVSGTSDLADTIKATKKPTIGMVNDGISASAGLWAMSACDEIYVTKELDMVGSCGVYTTLYDFNAYLEAQGLKVHEVYAPESTEKNGDVREAFQGNYEQLQADLSVIAQAFINTVAANRAGKIKGDSWKSGKMFYGKEATKLGLIDGIKSFDQIVKRMDQLTAGASAQSTTKKTSMNKTLAAAKATDTDFLSVGAGASIEQSGILLQAAHLEGIEATLEAQDGKIAELTGQVTAATTAKETAEASLATATESLATANATIATRDARIAELEAENAQLKDEPAGSFQKTSSKNDKTPGAGAKAVSPMDALADTMLGVPRAKEQKPE